MSDLDQWWACSVGHTLTTCSPECPGWGGSIALPDWYAETAARLIAAGAMTTPRTRAAKAQGGAA